MTIFQCPVCKNSLNVDENRYWCVNNHSFDRAKQGYVNLLLANQKKSQNPGDSRAMMDSRASFLAQGYYYPLADTLSTIVAKHRTNQSQNLLDAGCGEGYYTNIIAASQNDTLTCYGIDISKDAVKIAARQHKSIEFAVASVSHLPMMDNSVDFIVSIFSPRELHEMARVTRDNALLIVGTPAPNHLRELRQMIYDDIRDYEQLAPDTYAPQFEQVETQIIQYNITLNSPTDIANLLQMTPFYWHTPQEKQAQLLAMPQLTLTVAFEVSVWTPTNLTKT